jgi:hypothetical protein
MNNRGYYYITTDGLDNYRKELKEKFHQIINRIRKSEDNVRDIYSTLLEQINAYNVKIKTDTYGEYKDADTLYVHDLPASLCHAVQQVMVERDYKETTKATVIKNYHKFYHEIASIKSTHLWRVKKLLMACLNAVDENYWQYDTLRYQSEPSIQGYVDRKINRKFVGKNIDINVNSYSISALQRWCSQSLLENIYRNSENEYAEMLKQFNSYVKPSINDDRKKPW